MLDTYLLLSTFSSQMHNCTGRRFLEDGTFLYNYEYVFHAKSRDRFSTTFFCGMHSGGARSGFMVNNAGLDRANRADWGFRTPPPRPGRAEKAPICFA